MIYQTHILSNGLKIIHKPDTSDVSYCGLVVNVGSRDEENNEHGMAHFIEHMLFKGTKKRRSAHIINRLENVGGELNAYTSKEETVIYATVLNEYFERAMELIADIVFNSTFPQKEIDKEVVVIIDEIQSYNDSPSELIYDDFEEQIFQGHSIGHSILGNADLLGSYTTQHAFNFVGKHYLPTEMVFFVVGDIGFDKLIRMSEKYLQQISVSTEKKLRLAPQTYKASSKEIVKNTHQLHCILGNRAYSLHHPDRLAMYLLNNILGGPGMNSLLNLSLREKHGLVYNIESSFQPFTDTGMWSVYFGCDAENINKCVDLVYSELNKLKQKTLSASALKKYKLQLMGQMAIASEQKESLALSLGKSYLRYGVIEDLGHVKKRIELITGEKLQEIANEIFDFNAISTLKYT